MLIFTTFLKVKLNESLTKIKYKLMGLFVVLCGYSHKNQRGLELRIILSIENDEEPLMVVK